MRAVLSRSGRDWWGLMSLALMDESFHQQFDKSHKTANELLLPHSESLSHKTSSMCQFPLSSHERQVDSIRSHCQLLDRLKAKVIDSPRRRQQSRDKRFRLSERTSKCNMLGCGIRSTTWWSQRKWGSVNYGGGRRFRENYLIRAMHSLLKSHQEHRNTPLRQKAHKSSLRFRRMCQRTGNRKENSHSLNFPFRAALLNEMKFRFA